MVKFLYRGLRASGRFDPLVVSLATSSRDPSNVGILSPRSWGRGPAVTHGERSGVPFVHVGAWLGELEPFRYRPRRHVDEILQGADVVQVVCGLPAWASAVSRRSVPMALQVATLARWERGARLRGRGSLPATWWLRVMTALVERMETKAIRSADMVLVENSRMLEAAGAVAGPAKVRLAYPGVDCEVFHPPDDPRGAYLLAVGRFADPRKNVRLLFQAYALALGGDPNIPDLWVAGHSAPSERDLAYANELGISEKLRIVEGGTDQELAEIYRHALVVVVSSDEEGLGLVVLEAMASGVPVIATRCGGPEEAITDGKDGLLVPTNDAVAMRTAIDRLVGGESTRVAMGRAARATVAARFCEEVAIVPFLETYDRLVGTASHR